MSEQEIVAAIMAIELALRDASNITAHLRRDLHGALDALEIELANIRRKKPRT
jgi:hypothetical protein